MFNVQSKTDSNTQYVLVTYDTVFKFVVLQNGLS